MRSHRDPIYTEQVYFSYGYLPLTLSVNIVNSVLLGLALAPVAATSKVLSWLGLMVGLSALRLTLWYFHRCDAGRRQNPRWTHLAIVGAFASGVLWGSAPYVFYPLDERSLLFVALVIAGMCAGAATVHAAHFQSVIAFVAPATLPLALSFFVQGSRRGVVLGFMTCIFGISMCFASLGFRRWFQSITSAQRTIAQQAMQLGQTNARLESVIREHQSTELRLRHAQQQIQHQLAEVGKTHVIGQLAGGMAHDFNNVLGILVGNLELLQEYTGEDAAAEQLRNDALTGALHGAELTRQLLAFARRQPLFPRETDVNELIRSTARLLKRLLTEHIELRLDLEPNLGPAMIDPTQLEAAVVNLVSNARDAMKDGGMLTIATRMCSSAPVGIRTIPNSILALTFWLR